MGEQLSVTFSVISMKKMENDIVVPTKPIFIVDMLMHIMLRKFYLKHYVHIIKT